jgi:predicted RNase H-like HicB family nuclease
MHPDPATTRFGFGIRRRKVMNSFIAQVVEWSGIMAHGETREEAARQIQLALDGALELAAEQGIKPPGTRARACLVNLARRC